MKGWLDLKRFLRNGGFTRNKIVVGLDFDGTLSPIVRRPAGARLPGNMRRLLVRLARSRRILLAIVSGRSLADIKARVGLRGIRYSGNHGLEIQGPELVWRNPRADSAAEPVQHLALLLSRALKPFPGAHLENKGLTLTVHYRELAPENQPALGFLLARALKPYARRLVLASGKKSWEIRPKVRWNKGHALLKISRSAGKGAKLMFVGDDRTDEEGFRFLGRRAVTVRVGPAETSSAQYYLRSQRQVSTLLSFLCRSMPAKSRSSG